MPTRNERILIILAFFAIYIIWGSTYVFNKIAVTALPPFYLAGIRFFTASILLFVIAKALKLTLSITKNQLKNSILSGFFFLVYGNAVFVWALQFVDSGFAALIAAMHPLFVLVLMRIIDRKKMQIRSIIGISLGIVGMYLLVNQKELLATENTVLGIVMMLSCVLSWSYGSIFVSKADLPKHYFVVTAYQMLLASIMLVVLSLVLGEEWSNPLQWSTSVQLSMVMLIIFGGIVAFTAFNYLLKKVSTEKVATSSYVNPVIALFLGWYFLNEKLSLQSIIASVILLLGVFFITIRKRQQ